MISDERVTTALLEYNRLITKAIDETGNVTPADRHSAMRGALAAAAARPAAEGCLATIERDGRQRVVVEWGARCFGADHMANSIVRAARFFEEAAELVQAVGLPRDHAMRAFDHVYGRPACNVEQEAGGVAVTLMALCDALGLSADGCENKEIRRCLSKSPEHFAARNLAKVRDVDSVDLKPTADR